MKTLKNWFQKKIQAREERFFQKLKNSRKFSATEKKQILNHIQSGKLHDVVHIFFVFLVLSGIFSLGDLLVGAISVGISLNQGEPTFWPFFLFLLVTGLFKIWYAHISLLKFSWYDRILSTLPYVGATLLLMKGLQENPLTRRALILYLQKKL